MAKITIIKGDCLVESDKIESGSVDLILTDLPYGTMKGIDNVNHGMSGKCDWDSAIATDKIMSIADRILRRKGRMILTAQQPFTTELINKALTNLPLCYNMIWKKDHFANGLVSKKAPVNYYEDILVFSKEYDFECSHPCRGYFKTVFEYIGLNKKEIYMDLGHEKTDHCFRVNSSQFNLPTKTTYDELVKRYSIEKMEGFRPYDDLRSEARRFESTFNLWEGNKIKSNILEYKKDYDGLHPTQKPVLLLEDLIKTFSNEGDLVVDLTAGSFSTGVACVNTNRAFIGIEKDDSYFNIAKKRLEL
jgi:site-specific DNA-methyltransferase (adenine-specific)